MRAIFFVSVGLFAIGLGACHRLPPGPALPPPHTPNLDTAPPGPPPAPQGKGTDVGSGGDNVSPFSGTAWFLGKSRNVKYCISVHKDFGVSPAKAHEQLQRAIRTWRTYILERLTPGIFKGMDPRSQLTLGFVPTPGDNAQCQGDEDLVFYFGDLNQTVQAYYSRYINPTAFAQRLTIDPENGWSRGFIYVAPHHGVDTTFPNWEKEGALLGILLHELGHVLGNGHIAGTIMDARINSFLRDCGSWSHTRIDSHRELIHWTQTQFKVKTRLNRYYNSDPKAVFQAMMGRPPEGDIWAELTRAPGKTVYRWHQVKKGLGWWVPLIRHGTLSPLPSHSLSLWDDRSRTDFDRIPSASRATIGQVGPGTFFVYFPYRNRKEYLNPDLSPTYFETVTTPTEQNFAMTVEYGLRYPIQKVCYKAGIAPINLSIVVDGKPQHIARFALPHEDGD